MFASATGLPQPFVAKAAQPFTSTAPEAGESLFLLRGRMRTQRARAEVSSQSPGTGPRSISVQW